MADRSSVVVAAAWFLLGTGAAEAQSTSSIWAEAVSDDRRRGLSWSGGRAALRAGATVPVGASVELDAAATTARDSARHGGAEATVDLGARVFHEVGPLRLHAGITGHAFPGARRAPGWVEVGGGAGLLYGPVQIDLSARYAPRQSAIGGDNVYVALDARAGVPTTPFTVRAGVGRTSGDTDASARAARLRPDGDYWDWLLGVDYVVGRVGFGVDYVGTDISGGQASPYAEQRHARDTLLARVNIQF